MPVHCQDCNHHFLLDATTVAGGISCPGCGGKQVERDQPSSTQSDGELRDMVDPATQLDQGGNPLQEGVWAGVDGGWQPSYKRDESFASVQSSTHHPVMSSHDPRFYTSMEPYLPWTHEATEKEAFLPALAPLAMMGGRMLLGQAIGGLMRRAINGQGNTMPMQPNPYAEGGRPVGLVASQHTALGTGAPVETPGSVPHLDDSHDPEAVDQQEFNDQDTSPAFNNPNNDDADAGMAMSQGEDGVNQKLEFRHDGDGVGHAEMLLPLLMEYVNSDKSALDNPQLKALHEQLESEIPDYLNLADENDPKVHEFLEELKKPHHDSKVGAPVYMTTPMIPGQQQMGMPGMGQQGQLPMPGTHANPVGPGGMSVTGKCANCGSVTNADGSCPQCGASPGANQMGNMEQPGQQHLQTPGIMPSPYARQAADHQGPITPQQKEVFSQYLIQQGRENEVAAMMGNPALYADEWAQYLNRSTQPPEVDPTQQAPQPQMDPSQMGQMPMPGMSLPPGGGPTASTKTADNVAPRCPNCTSATTSVMGEGKCRCHRCQHIWEEGSMVKDSPTSSVKRSWVIKKTFQDNMTPPSGQAPSQAPNPVAAPAADATAPGDRENQQDSSLTWQASDGTPLQVGQTYEMHNPGYAIPDVVKVQAVKPDAITVTMEGEYNSPSDPQDEDGPGYTHEITREELQSQGLTFNPAPSGEGDQQQSQDQTQQDGIGQTVNTEPVQQSPEVPYHASVEVLPTDHCPKCSYGHVTSSYLSADTVNYECYRCAHAWQIKDADEGVEAGGDSRAWLNESSIEDEVGFDPRTLAMAQAGGQGRNLSDIAQRDPRLQAIKERLNANKTAGAKFSPSQQKQFIDEDGVARNADRLNLDGTHYIESGFDNSKARPDRVDDNYIGLGL